MSDVFDPIVVPKIRYGIEFAVLRNGSSPAHEFFVEMDIKSKAKLLANFKHVATHGELNPIPARFKHERDELWAFKGKQNRRMFRMPCFRRGTWWIITHGFWKPSQSLWPEKEFTAAFRILNEVVELEVSDRATQSRRYEA